MDLFLKILSGIGLTLLIILIVILSILLLVLFVPVRYGGSGSFKDNKLSFSARASWLLGLVSVKFLFGDEDPLRIKVLFFRLNKKDKKPKTEKIKKDKRKKDKAKKKKSEEFAPSDETDSKENNNKGYLVYILIIAGVVVIAGISGIHRDAVILGILWRTNYSFFI